MALGRPMSRGVRGCGRRCRSARRCGRRWDCSGCFYLLGENGREQLRGDVAGARGSREKGRSNCLGEKGTSPRAGNDCWVAVVWAILGLPLMNLKFEQPAATGKGCS